MPDYDVLIYRDFADTMDVPVSIGTPGSDLGLGADLHIVAIGPPIHPSKDRTIVLAHGNDAMDEIQKMLDEHGP